MPRFPDIAPTVTRLGGSVFSNLVRRMRQRGGEIFPFHIGDTWLEPLDGGRMEDLAIRDHPEIHRYAPVRGHPDLLDALSRRVSHRQQVTTSRANLLVTAGATGGLSAAVGAVVEPGEEVLLAAPYWPLIAGIVTAFRAKPVAVPLFGIVESAEAAVEAFSKRLSERTVAVYWNTPNNPTGRSLPVDWLSALVRWAEDQGLWILADEVYEDLTYGAEHSSTRSLAPDQTFSVHSFSKSYGMAGNRCGYVAGPVNAISETRKISTHTFYSAPTASQIAASRVLSERGDSWLEQARAHYEKIGCWSADRLGVDHPDGGTFLFLDVSQHLGRQGLPGFLEQCVEHGVLVAPGTSFGPFESHIRISFTSTPPQTTKRGIEVLARLLGR